MVADSRDTKEGRRKEEKAQILQKQKMSGAHFEDFHHHFLIVGHIYGLEYFAVLPSAQFTHQLIVVLIAEKETKQRKWDYDTMIVRSSRFLRDYSTIIYDLEHEAQQKHPSVLFLTI